MADEQYAVLKQGDHTSAYVMELQCDTLADMASLPDSQCAPGSTCIILENSSVYALGTDGTWHEL